MLVVDEPILEQFGSKGLLLAKPLPEHEAVAAVAVLISTERRLLIVSQYPWIYLIVAQSFSDISINI
jgi:hypothetical protein